jgi:ABC-type dipeptide/oligopeptide/nickel transport system permease component
MSALQPQSLLRLRTASSSAAIVELRYVAKRLAGAAFTLAIAVTLNFFLFRAAPGNAASLAHVPSASPQLHAALTREFGLDKSVGTQFISYVEQLLHGNLGVSFATQRPVGQILTSTIGHTLIYGLPGIAVAMVLALASGLISAWRHGTVTDHVSRSVALAFYALPAQWLAIVFIFLAKGHLPAGGMSDPFNTSTGWGHIEDVARHTVLPAGTYALIAYGAIMIVFRTSLLQSLSEDYVLTAKAKGLTDWQVVRRHAVPNALLPVTTIFGLTLGTLVAGVLLIETAFSWPGIGFTVYQAVQNRDYPVLQGAFLVLTAAVVLANLAVDLLYRRLDPRVRLEQRA